jgi:hypothetical protein
MGDLVDLEKRKNLLNKKIIDETHRYLRSYGDDMLYRAVDDFLNLKSNGYIIHMHPAFDDVIYNIYRKDIDRMDLRFRWKKTNR